MGAEDPNANVFTANTLLTELAPSFLVGRLVCWSVGRLVSRLVGFEFFFFFFFGDTIHLCSFGAWPRTHRGSPISASGVLGLPRTSHLFYVSSGAPTSLQSMICIATELCL